METLILLALIALNGVFAMSEIALVTSRKARLLNLASEGRTSADIALRLGENPTCFLSTIQIGITSIGILNGIVGESVLAAPFSNWMHSFGLPEPVSSFVATGTVVLLITYVSIVIGELVPKRIGQINAENIACLIARPIHALSLLTRPFVLLLSLSTNALLRIMGIEQKGLNSVTEDEIRAVLDEGEEAGIIEQQEHEMVRNVFRLDDRKLGSLMVPRSDLVYLDIAVSPEENMRRLTESEFSRFPVCDGGLEKLLGVLHVKQALTYVVRGEVPDFSSNLQPCVFVPETLTGMELLEQFRLQNIQMAFVIDEYGSLEGIVTLQDLLEAVTGEFTPSDAEDSLAIQRDGGSWLLDGAFPVVDLKELLGIKTLPEDGKGHYHTVSGLFMLLLGRVPSTGDSTEWEGWRLEIVDMDQKRIDKILATPLLNIAGEIRD